MKTWHLSAYDSRDLRRGGLSWQQNGDAVLGIVRVLAPLLDAVSASASSTALDLRITASVPNPVQVSLPHHNHPLQPRLRAVAAASLIENGDAEPAVAQPVAGSSGNVSCVSPECDP